MRVLLLSATGYGLAAQRATAPSYTRSRHRASTSRGSSGNWATQVSAAAGDPLHRDGVFWAIWTPIAEDGLPCPTLATTALAETATRLSRLDSLVLECLINWGYAACDASLRCHDNTKLSAPKGFPNPGGGHRESTLKILTLGAPPSPRSSWSSAPAKASSSPPAA